MTTVALTASGLITLCACCVAVISALILWATQ